MQQRLLSGPGKVINVAGEGRDGRRAPGRRGAVPGLVLPSAPARLTQAVRAVKQRPAGSCHPALFEDTV